MSEWVGRYVDLQVNGFAGVDFNDPSLESADVVRAARAMLDAGYRHALPTVITAPLPDMERCLQVIARAIAEDEIAGALFPGVHVEGPFLSPEKGYIGAHPPSAARQPDLQVLERLWDASNANIQLLTLAPEIDTEATLTGWSVARGITVAAGHTNATVEQLATCIEAGLKLFTHLANGCPRLMDRHDNIILRALTFRDQLHVSLIADGFHVPQMLFQLFLQWLPPEKVCVVSDAISAAGLGPGTYRLGEREIVIGEDKCARDSSGEHFVGSAASMRDAETWLQSTLGLGTDRRRQMLCENPANLIGLSVSG